MRTLAAITLLVLVALFASAAADPGEVTLILDAAEYVQGDVVTVTLHNGTDVAIQLVSQPWFCVDRLDGEYPPCVGLPVIFDLDPGETLVGTHDTAQLPDQPGQYVVWAATGAVEPVPYRLVAEVENHENSWSTLKSIFR
jgi:hypothetical protein